MNMTKPLISPTRRTGFSLVELSIVIAILGLLVGGVMAGQSLVASSELNRFINTVKQYDATVSSFYNKYNALPGDMANATSFFGTVSGGGTCPTGATGNGIGTCNGDGNGLVEHTTGCTPPARCEGNFIFEHLRLAGLVETFFRATNGLTGSLNAPGAAPRNLLREASVLIFIYAGPPSQTGQTPVRSSLYGKYTHAFVFGNRSNIGSQDGVLSAEKMWTIDTKMDDGMPATGRVLGAQGHTANGNGVPNECTNPGSWFSQSSPGSGVNYTPQGPNPDACVAAFIYDEDE